MPPLPHFHCSLARFPSWYAAAASSTCPAAGRVRSRAERTVGRCTHGCVVFNAPCSAAPSAGTAGGLRGGADPAGHRRGRQRRHRLRGVCGQVAHLGTSLVLGGLGAVRTHTAPLSPSPIPALHPRTTPQFSTHTLIPPCICCTRLAGWTARRRARGLALFCLPASRRCARRCAHRRCVVAHTGPHRATPLQYHEPVYAGAGGGVHQGLPAAR